MSKKYENLIVANNEVIRLSKKRLVTTPRMISALRKAIAGYEELINNYDPKTVEPLSPEEAGYTEKDAFERKFVPHEQKILRNSDFTDGSRRVLIKQTRKIKKTESSDISSTGIHELKSNKAELEQLLAELVHPEKELPKRLETKRRVRRKWGRISKLVGGATLIALDTAAVGANPALAPVTAVSVAAGGVLVSEGRSKD